MPNSKIQQAQEHAEEQKERDRKMKITNQINRAHIEKMEAQRGQSKSQQRPPTAFEIMMQGEENKEAKRQENMVG